MRISGLSVVILLAAAQAPAQPIGPTLTYQGKLTVAGSPASGLHDFRFRLYDAAAAGNQVGPQLCRDNVGLSAGVSTHALDFGPVFQGQQRFLEIEVRADTGLDCAGPSGFVTLSPRQALTAAPYASYAAGNWGLSGNAGISAAHFVGTTDSAPVELRVNNLRVARYALAADASFRGTNVLSGFEGNEIGPGIHGATVAGGGRAVVSGGASLPNRALANLATVSGGEQNTAGGHGSVVAGGAFNSASGFHAMVAGGSANIAAGNHAFAAGRTANANHSGSFVWSDGSQTPFASTAANQFLIRAAGGVGINTNAPGSTLEVAGGVRARGGPPGAHGGNNNGYAFAFNGGDTDSGLFSLADGLLSLFTNSEERLRIDGQGFISIGAPDALGFRLAVNGDAAKPGGGSWAVYSDARLKTGFAPMTGTLDKLLSLRGYEFEYSSDAVERNLGLPGRQIGLVAQEVQSVFPGWVGRDAQGYLHITERATTALMIEAFRDLRTECDRAIARKEAEIAALRVEHRETVSSLTARIDRLERLLTNHAATGE